MARCGEDEGTHVDQLLGLRDVDLPVELKRHCVVLLVRATLGAVNRSEWDEAWPKCTYIGFGPQKCRERQHVYRDPRKLAEDANATVPRLDKWMVEVNPFQLNPQPPRLPHLK